MRKKLLACLLSVMFIVGFSLTLPAATAAESSSYVLIIRDNYGVPHIFSDTKEGLAFGCGYAMAQDRLWQADIYRRVAFGSLAEFGMASIDDDYETRSLGYSREELREIYDNWVPTNPKARLKEMFEAYLDGINLYIYQAMDSFLHGDLSLIPIEYLPGVITPDGLLPIEPFTMEDSVAITVMMAWRFGGCGGGELGYAAALQALQAMHGPETGWLIFNDLYPQVDPGTEATIPSEGSWYPCGSMPETFLPSNIGDIYREYEEAKMGHDQLLESLGIPTEFGSNAWMVSPWKSKTRNALQVGGPQMGHSIPQIVLEMGLHGDGINAVGMMMPQAPAILIGVSEYGAWTSTTGCSDVMDTYVEVLNPANHTEYLYNGEWVPMEVRTETIYGYKKLYHENRTAYRTVHGPVFLVDEENHLAFAMKAPYYKNELQAEEGWSLYQQARNIWEFQEAVKTIQPAHNFYWIDREGNVGYWHAGTFPIKPTTGMGGRLIDDRFPLWGTGEEEWVGLTGFEEMPKCINPEQGWLANWNNKPIADWTYREVDWGEGHWVGWIQEQLAAGKKFTFEDMNEINRDTAYNHVPGWNFLDYLIEAAKKDRTVPRAVIRYLKDWNHHYNDVEEPRWPSPDATYDDPGLTILDAWFNIILGKVFLDDLGFAAPSARRLYSTLIHVFDGPDSKLPLSYDYLNGRDRDEVIVEALKEALAELEADLGPDMSTWLTPVRTVTFDRMGALPAPTMHDMNRGTYNHIAEMPRRAWGKPPHAVDVIPPGQSGFMKLEIIDGVPTPVPSPHAYDQLPLYETWTYKPMLYRIKDILEVAESQTFLIYPL